MKPNEINEAIKAHLGIKSCERCNDPECAYNMTKDYSGDLNAMHEADGTLSGLHIVKYEMHLASATQLRGRSYAIFATAIQRAEAFLRAIGKWKEAE